MFVLDDADASPLPATQIVFSRGNPSKLVNQLTSLTGIPENQEFCTRFGQSACVRQLPVMFGQLRFDPISSLSKHHLGVVFGQIILPI